MFIGRIVAVVLAACLVFSGCAWQGGPLEGNALILEDPHATLFLRPPFDFGPLTLAGIGFTNRSDQPIILEAIGVSADEGLTILGTLVYRAEEQESKAAEFWDCPFPPSGIKTHQVEGHVIESKRTTFAAVGVKATRTDGKFAIRHLDVVYRVANGKRIYVQRFAGNYGLEPRNERDEHPCEETHAAFSAKAQVTTVNRPGPRAGVAGSPPPQGEQ